MRALSISGLLARSKHKTLPAAQAPICDWFESARGVLAGNRVKPLWPLKNVASPERGDTEAQKAFCVCTQSLTGGNSCKRAAMGESEPLKGSGGLFVRRPEKKCDTEMDGPVPPPVLCAGRSEGACEPGAHSELPAAGPELPFAELTASKKS